MLFQLLQRYNTGGGQLRSVFQYLQDYGFQDFILPALLIFTLIFAILQQVPLFRKVKKKAVENPTTHAITYETEMHPAGHPDAGKPVMIGDKRINSVIALAISLMVTIPHVIGWYPPGQDPIDLISGFLPATAVMLVAVFVVLLLLGLAGGAIPSMMVLTIALVAGGFLVMIFGMNMFPTWLPTFDFLRDPAIQALIIVLLTMGLVGYWVIRPEPTPPVPGEEGWFKKWVTTRR